MPPSNAELLAAICNIAARAGDAILAIKRDGFDVTEKPDSSPVTAADHAAEALILPALAKLLPGVPIVAEESVAAGDRPDISGGRFWLVDPLDGTKEFIAGRDDYTVNIALIDGGAPILGAVGVPARQMLYAGCGPGTATRRTGTEPAQTITARTPPGKGAVVVASRSHGDSAKLHALTDTLPEATIALAGSSVKFCLIAAGEADIYPRHGPTCEWDIAAGHAVLKSAGGSVRTLDGAALTYGKVDFLNPPFIARGRDE